MGNINSLNQLLLILLVWYISKNDMCLPFSDRIVFSITNVYLHYITLSKLAFKIFKPVFRMFQYETMGYEDYYTRNQLTYIMFLCLVQHLSQFAALIFFWATIFNCTPNTMAMVKCVWWVPVSFGFHQHIVIFLAPVPMNVKNIS